MKIAWADVNWTDQPGLYRLADGREVQVGAHNIAQWRQDPAGAFETFWYPGSPGRPALLSLTVFHTALERAREDA